MESEPEPEPPLLIADEGGALPLPLPLPPPLPVQRGAKKVVPKSGIATRAAQAVRTAFASCFAIRVCVPVGPVLAGAGHGRHPVASRRSQTDAGAVPPCVVVTLSPPAARRSLT